MQVGFLAICVTQTSTEKCSEITTTDQNNLHIKFLAQNVDVSHLSFDIIGSKSPTLRDLNPVSQCRLRGTPSPLGSKFRHKKL